MITKITVQIAPEDSKGAGIVAFYDNVAAALGLDTSRLRYDCTKIYVSRNIQTNIFEVLDAQSSDPCYTGTMWCLRGPKTEDTLPDDTAELLDGFFLRDETPLTLSLTTAINRAAA
ncbi:MAG: hypothetical protein LBL15_06800 [Oscillospiraceae bacterium]|jgi:hypothetical protein|nr:hypothetical protein [Oscillospiraceae bacterium]